MKTSRFDTTKKAIILNKPFLGGWLNNQGNIGHEIIDFLLTDNNEYYIYNNPLGACPYNIWVSGSNIQRKSMEKYTARYMALTSAVHDKSFDILYVIELTEKLHQFHTTENEIELRNIQEIIIEDIIKKRDIKYNGKYLNEIYGDDDSLYLTFKAKKLYKAENPICVEGLSYNFQRNKGYLYNDKAVEDYKLVEDIISDSIKNGTLLEITPKNVRRESFERYQQSKTFLNLIAQETNEQVFTNILHNFLSQGNMINRFCERFKGDLEFNFEDNYQVFRETKVVEGRMDVCAESENRRIIIENKVYSGLNGIKPIDNTTQLSTYYNWGREKGTEPLCFITLPNHRVNEVRREIEKLDTAMQDKYRIITYGEVAAFIEEEQNNIPEDYPYQALLPDIIKSFRNLSYLTKEDYYANRFLDSTIEI